MIEEIKHDGQLIALILYKNYHREGISFLTDKQSQLQLGYIGHPAGYVVKPHMHKLINKTTCGTQEVLFIKSGKIKIDFYTSDKVYLESKVLSTGDLALLMDGGHGITILEPTSIIEVKSGPYLEDKERFEGK